MEVSGTSLLQARCLSSHPTNSVQATKRTQSTDYDPQPGKIPHWLSPSLIHARLVAQPRIVVCQSKTNDAFFPPRLKRETAANLTSPSDNGWGFGPRDLLAGSDPVPDS